LKKLISILLIGLFLFDIFGYVIVFQFMQDQAGTKLEARLDKNQYDDSQLIEFKIPVNVAYQTSRSDYERVDGEVQVGGAIYKYVKRKIENDTLYLMCIPHTQKMHLEVVMNDLFKIANGFSQTTNSNNQDNSSISFKNIFSPFDDFVPEYQIGSPDLNTSKRQPQNVLSALPIPLHFSLDQPPEGSLI